MGKNNTTQNGGVGFFSLLTLLFIGLKLGGFIAWSWWWVLICLWLPLLLVILGIILMFIFSISFD